MNFSFRKTKKPDIPAFLFINHRNVFFWPVFFETVPGLASPKKSSHVSFGNVSRLVQLPSKVSLINQKG
ncbi:MAG: hypothetical protein A3B08_03855 [Candidatus Taylorbacteria bacterium RIFCSPLOWO2_01_FULL_43_44]|nr:MAG: hypothetical protein A3B08_03855 [Candidatus Taylorbacteria bacterium RIFCSPLOWO2_01_FULL_43_44]